MISGVYQILNTVTGFSYIGSSANVDRRIKEQKNHLRKNRSDNSSLQLDWNNYGESCFEFNVLSLCSVDQLFKMEQALINTHDSYNKGYNMIKVGGSVLGIKRSESSKQKMRGNTNASGGKGRKHSEETKLKMSLSKKGKSSGMKGKHHSLQSKEKMAQSHLGVKRSGVVRTKFQKKNLFNIY